MYYTENDKDPLLRKKEAEENAKAANSNLVFLHPSLVFGDDSYLIRYMIQSVVSGSIPQALAEYNNTRFFPIHTEDLARVIKHSIENFDEAKSQSWRVSGADKLTLKAIKDLIVKHSKKDATVASSLGLSSLLSEFWTGVTHDQNMLLMTEYYNNNPAAHSDENDYLQKHGLQCEHSLSGYLEKLEYKEDNFVYPLFTGYRSTELD